jgi:hypothetical protein
VSSESRAQKWIQSFSSSARQQIQNMSGDDDLSTPDLLALCGLVILFVIVSPK